MSLFRLTLVVYILDLILADIGLVYTSAYTDISDVYTRAYINLHWIVFIFQPILADI